MDVKKRRQNYQVSALDLNALNQVFSLIERRLDQVDAVGQSPDFKGKRLLNVLEGSIGLTTLNTQDFTNSRLIVSDADNGLASVLDLTLFIAGTTNRITVSNDADGTVTLTIPDTPQLVGMLLSGLTASQALVTDVNKNLASLAGSDTDFTVVTAIQAGGGGGIGFQYKTRALTLEKGIITAVAAESGWNDI